MQLTQNLLETTLQKTFGIDHFRKGQRQAIETLLTKGRLLCILPTGYGKSLLYQLPAVLLDGLTLVISPLLALMRDQIGHLNNRFNIPSLAINSDQSNEENAHAERMAYERKIKILFIAPEQLDHIDRFQFLQNLKPQLVVIDEAHCISTWGHDFRPSYRQILNFANAVSQENKNVKILGLTATANAHVEADISKQLFSSEHQGTIIRQSMDRPNIELSVLQLKGLASKLAACDALLKQLKGCGLIYCATRENTELVAGYLQDQQHAVASYHAGYENEEKIKLQREFIEDKYKALAATNALGMGIDKSNLRFIIHFDVPGSITAYYQEVGRCGRDGHLAKGILLFDKADCSIQEYFIQSAVPAPEDFQITLGVIERSETPLGLTSIKSLTGLHPTRVTIVIAELVEQGYLKKESQLGKQVYRLTQKKDQTLLDLARYKTQQSVKFQELSQMANYGNLQLQCRMATLRRALGDTSTNQCSHCDCCRCEVTTLKFSETKLASITSWLDNRPVKIAGTAKDKLSEGISVLDSKRRSPLFIRFMKERSSCPEGTLGMDDDLLTAIKSHLMNIVKNEPAAGILLLPSRTWQAQERLAKVLGNAAQIPVFGDVLSWGKIPVRRQGELLNNDQRRDNVKGRMQAKPIAKAGTIILFDDYIGSGSTIREAARALRAAKIHNKILPFTIASVQWHLGKPGFV